MTKEETYTEIVKEVAYYINLHNEYRKDAGKSADIYDCCQKTMSNLYRFIEFVEKYLGYKITIKTTTNGNQYMPDKILGW